MLRGKGSPYEVRCLRCDVSFPVEAKRCIHCGGKLSASEAVPLIGSYPGPIETAPTDVLTTRSFPTSASPPASSGTGPIPFPGDPGRAGDPDEAASGGAPSLGATLLRSFGSLFWVIAVIAYSLLRSCQAEG